MVVITKAVDRDLPDVLSLLKEVDLPVEGVADHFHNFFVARQGECIVGCAGVEIYENSGLMRSVAVHPSFQDQGLGRELVEKIEDFANEEHLKEIYLLTDTAEQFFSNLNYKIIPREDVNPKVKQSSEFTSVCDISAVCMKKVPK